MLKYTLKIGKNQSGFTLIEALVAAVVLVVGIFALYSMQTTAMKYNAKASGITTSSTWAADRIEQLLALDYDDAALADSDGDGLAGLPDTGAAADGTDNSPDGNYAIFWNTAPLISPNPDDATINTLKAIQVIVQRNDFGVTHNVTLNYYKQRTY